MKWEIFLKMLSCIEPQTIIPNKQVSIRSFRKLSFMCKELCILQTWDIRVLSFHRMTVVFDSSNTTNIDNAFFVPRMWKTIFPIPLRSSFYMHRVTAFRGWNILKKFINKSVCITSKRFQILSKSTWFSFTYNIMWIMRSKEEDICDYFI